MHFLPATAAPARPSTKAWTFAFHDGRLLLPEGGPLAGAAPLPDAAHYLGTLDGDDCWVLRLDAAPAAMRALPLRAAMLELAPPLAALAGRAAQVLEWDRTHRHCGVCGSATAVVAGERARRCPGCGHTAYPRLSPAMMALVWRPGEVLLARSPHYTAGMYSALAGFVEAGESIEDCVLREVAEEVAVQVTDLRYYGSQSWPFPHSLMVAFNARWTGGDIVPQPAEIEDARWFPIDALPPIPPRLSIAGHLIRDTVAALHSGALSA